MKREIKFRAWNGERMIYESLQDEYDDYYMLNLQGEFFPHTRTGDEYFLSADCEVNKKKYDLMQYTGLKDKNGKEMYEGDICRVDYYELGLVNGKVVFRVGYSGYYLEGEKFQETMGAWESKFIEVIGNIYENPELIAS